VVFSYEKRLKLMYGVNDKKLEHIRCYVLVVKVWRHVILLSPYGPSRICGLRVRHRACSHIRAHKSDQRAPVDHPGRREQVLCMRGDKSEMGLEPRTRKRMVVYQLVYYKIVK
jgi:hypothetical protein